MPFFPYLLGRIEEAVEAGSAPVGNAAVRP